LLESLIGREALLSLGVAAQKLACKPCGVERTADGGSLSHRDGYDDALG
jgi:hypothetical protein